VSPRSSPQIPLVRPFHSLTGPGARGPAPTFSPGGAWALACGIPATREAARSLTTVLRNRQRRGEQDPAARSVLKQVSSLSQSTLCLPLSHSVFLQIQIQIQSDGGTTNGHTASIYSLSLSVCVSLSLSIYFGWQTAAAPPSGWRHGGRWRGQIWLMCWERAHRRAREQACQWVQGFFCFLSINRGVRSKDPASVE
jgi:hypothetical protein